MWLCDLQNLLGMLPMEQSRQSRQTFVFNVEDCHLLLFLFFLKFVSLIFMNLVIIRPEMLYVFDFAFVNYFAVVDMLLLDLFDVILVYFPVFFRLTHENAVMQIIGYVFQKNAKGYTVHNNIAISKI